MHIPQSKRIAMAVYSAASMLDTLTTAYRLQRHPGTEFNPLIHYAMTMLGTAGGLAATTAAEGAALMTAAARRKEIGYFSSTQALYLGAAFHLAGAARNAILEITDRL